MRTIERILVPVDFSASSRSALDLALGLARSFGAEVHVIHVVELPLYSTPDIAVSLAGQPAQSYVAYAHGRANEAMMDFLSAHRDADLTHEIVTGEPSSTILARAQDGRYDLIVMGTHGRRGLKHLLLGSTAEWLVRNAACPVLTTREEGTRPQ